MTTTSTDRTDLGDAQIVDPRAVSDLMLAFEQVCRVGIIYPPGHSLCEQAAGFFLQAMIRVLGKAEFLSLEHSGDTFSVQGVELDEDPKQTSTLPTLLGQLGIAQVFLDRDLTAQDLYAFVGRLFTHRNEIRNARRFRELVITDMPATVRIRQREFQSLRDTEDGADDGAVVGQTSIGTVISALARQGLDNQQLDTCRRLLDAVPGRLEEWQQLEGALPRVSWADVEKLLLRAAQQSARPPAGEIQPQTPGHSALDTLTAVFRRLGDGDEVTEHRQAIDLLLSLNQRGQKAETDETASDAPNKPIDNREESGPTATAVLDALDSYARGAEPTTEIELDNPAEQLSILMLLLGRDQKLPVQVRIEKQLRKIFAGSLTEDANRILIAGIRQLLEAGEHARFAGATVLVTSALRETSHDGALALLLEVARDQDPDHLAELWPFLVNEILLTRKPRKSKHFLTACVTAAELPDDYVDRVLPDLEHLEALREQRVLSDVFLSPSPALRKIFVRLLDTGQAAFVGRQLIVGLRRSPLGWLDAAVLPLIERFTPRHRGLLAGLLRLGDEEHAPPKLIKAAGRVVTEALPVLDWSRRKEPWVPKTVAAVPRLNLPDGEAILRHVQREKQFLIIPAWPRSCRDAARAALRQLEIYSEAGVDTTDGGSS